MKGPNQMSHFDPEKLAAIQSDEIEITVPRAVAAVIAECFNNGDPDLDSDHDEATIDAACDIADALRNFARTGIDDPDAVFCIACGQPDEPELHDPAKCGAGGAA